MELLSNPMTFQSGKLRVFDFRKRVTSWLNELSVRPMHEAIKSLISGMQISGFAMATN